MKIRAFATAVPTVVTAVVAMAVLLPPPAVSAGDASAPPSAAISSNGDTVPDESVSDDTRDDMTRPTVNEFLPERRPLGDCLGALQRPNCGSDARGGWAQTAVFVALVGGLAFIAWRVVVASRRARAAITTGTPGATNAPDDAGGAPPP